MNNEVNCPDFVYKIEDAVDEVVFGTGSPKLGNQQPSPINVGKVQRLSLTGVLVGFYLGREAPRV
ncbi:MAG: hypothetical protein COV08_03185 [Candidatus Vogelbacteria bacterium CG10_big_fil_rev_8_21_14_0_10_49_38]|uniref:Uncharacterized protein n=1 Tax=Candidatus Vogelbacteria bacterium CG10_big_fil_rev_8_21_14_0_10_49_38 TaxID=1975043 RepID=A0A2H0RH18_9BACT|nr:MAG: hypothetical protein BK006_03190 [bacterium CG10_49_38]PIR45803.1 MAG: hypothetical protein COV08_03185 [Candidatus Vogelbacteria bacterium CG10_big_fil_rev_8_21_14_0_10_49_38]